MGSEIIFKLLYTGTSIMSLPLLIYITFQIGKTIQKINQLDIRVTKIEDKIFSGDK